MKYTPPSVPVELWLAKRLQAPLLFAGLTTAEERKARLRRTVPVYAAGEDE